MNKWLSILLIFSALNSNAQKESLQEFGLNMVGLAIKKEPTMASALYYKYSFNSIQFRSQLALDGTLNSKKQSGKFTQSFPSFFQSFDTSVQFKPGKNLRTGLVVGLQKNSEIENSSFQFYYGLDAMYFLNDLKQSGKGILKANNGVIDSSLANPDGTITVDSEIKLKTYALGTPVGIIYTYKNKIRIGVEAKFIVAITKGKLNNLVETLQIQNNQEIRFKTGRSETIKEIDMGIKPLTGIFLGILF